MVVLCLGLVAPQSTQAAAPRFEAAIAADLTGSGRDAIVFRLPDGAGAGVFLPQVDGSFTLKILPALGPDVGALTLGDADRDGVADLLVTRTTGAHYFWKGITGGDFTSDLVVAEPDPHDMHAAHRAAAVGPPALTASERDRILAALAPDSSRTDPEMTEQDARSAALLDGVRLPEGFVPRLVVAGRFGPDGARALAVIGEGSRPRLVLVPTAPSTTSSAAALDQIAYEVEVPHTIFNVNVGSGGFSFAPATVNIQVNDTVHWIWVANGHTVTSGADCEADNLFCSPTDTNCALAPLSNNGATYNHVFPAAGSFPYFCNPHCSFMTGTVNVQAPAGTPGRVPDRLPAVPLRVAPAAGGMLALTWGASCSPGVTAYGIYEGTIPLPGTYNHASNVCPAGTATSATITPTAGNHYFLVVPRTATAEGSYGKSSANVERPVGSGVCVATQNMTACP